MAAVKTQPPAPPVDTSAQAQPGEAKVVVHTSSSASAPVKKPSPADQALKKAKSEATEAKKKVKHAEKQLSEAKKDYEKKKGEIKKIQKQKKEEKKTTKKKPKPPVAPVLTAKTSPDMQKRLHVHSSKHKSGKKVTITVSSSAHSG
ncbi:hypothetical protein BBK82_30305 [Lentzea guizhouensis]|uniref:Uncharacterized protein n=1 Tax=Lentzea guizhouensis TaxID=1586287 RepID=A0A1B2HPU2_9PSEU|nr:hypothetical protein BBK82_30305 [Lentzea guizhouensis]